ncbi:unnamed protein product, partial [Ixodes pacificus]
MLASFFFRLPFLPGLTLPAKAHEGQTTKPATAQVAEVEISGPASRDETTADSSTAAARPPATAGRQSFRSGRHRRATTTSGGVLLGLLRRRGRTPRCESSEGRRHGPSETTHGQRKMAPPRTPSTSAGGSSSPPLLGTSHRGHEHSVRYGESAIRRGSKEKK